jgi:hypothetical protein
MTIRLDYGKNSFGGCLHQVYISTGGRYRLLSSSHVPELDLTQVKPAAR